METRITMKKTSKHIPFSKYYNKYYRIFYGGEPFHCIILFKKNEIGLFQLRETDGYAVEFWGSASFPYASWAVHIRKWARNINPNKYDYTFEEIRPEALLTASRLEIRQFIKKNYRRVAQSARAPS